MLISFAICLHDEKDYIIDLLRRINAAKVEYTYEIIILDDNSSPDTINAIHATSLANDIITRKHTGNYAEQKNFLNGLCNGDYIVNLDADEYLQETFLFSIEDILVSNPSIELYFLPRINIVRGITHRYIAEYGWHITQVEGYRETEHLAQTSDEYQVLKDYNLITDEEDGWVTYNQPIIQWPDWQGRIYKNSSHIKWEGKVHEKIIGAKAFTTFPAEPLYAIHHIKDIKRQVTQNITYTQLQKEG